MKTSDQRYEVMLRKTNGKCDNEQNNMAAPLV